MSGFNFMGLARAEFARRAAQAAATGQKIQSDRGPAKAKPAPQMSSAEQVERQRKKADKGRARKEARSRRRGAQVAGAVGDFAGAVAAGMLAEARQKGVGAGAAVAFAQGVQPIVDYGKMMRGKADPGTILGRVGMKAMQDNQRFSVGDAAKAAGQAAADVLDDEPVDPLDLEPDELGTESIMLSQAEVAAAARAAVEAATGPKDPFEGVAPADRATFIELGMGGERLTDEQIVTAMNDLTNKYGAVKAGELVRMIQQQGSVVYDDQGQAQDPFGIFATTDDIPQGKD